MVAPGRLWDRDGTRRELDVFKADGLRARECYGDAASRNLDREEERNVRLIERAQVKEEIHTRCCLARRRRRRNDSFKR